MARLSNQQILDAGLVDWRKLAQALHARYSVPDYVVAAAFIATVAEVAEADRHHPDLKLAYGVIDVSLSTHEDGLWVTQKDIDMARKITDIAKEKELAPEPTAVTQLETAEQRSVGSRPSGGSRAKSSCRNRRAHSLGAPPRQTATFTWLLSA
jgi:4a-hydroxytetrahydrobiopterin dehydratase